MGRTSMLPRPKVLQRLLVGMARLGGGIMIIKHKQEFRISGSQNPGPEPGVVLRSIEEAWKALGYSTRLFEGGQGLYWVLTVEGEVPWGEETNDDGRRV